LRSRIFFKLFVVLLLVTGSLMVSMLWVINGSFRAGFDTYLIERELPAVEQAAQRLAEYYQQEGEWRGLEGNPRRWRRVLESESMVFARRPPRGHRPPPPDFFEPGRPPVHHAGPSPRGSDPLAAQSLPRRLILTDVDKQWLFGSRQLDQVVRWLPISGGGVTTGWLGLIPQALETDQLAQHFVEQQRDNVLWLAGGGLCLVLLLSALLARLFVRPVTRVALAAEKLAGGDLEVRVPVARHRAGRRDELDQLSASFNQMAARLQQAAQLRQQWISDISHELRTPIAVLSGEIEAMLDGIREPTPERIGSLHGEVNGLVRLVGDLHQLALSDQSALELKVNPVDLERLCHTQLALFKPRMAAGQLSLMLQTQPDQHFQVLGDERRLSQLLTNLLENSLRYTDAGGTVAMVLACDGDGVRLMVEDSTPGVPEAALGQIFERLYRVDRSRSRALGGSGLGLSICRSLVEAHGGTIQASNRPEGGLRISVWLPRTPVSGVG